MSHLMFADAITVTRNTSVTPGSDFRPSFVWEDATITGQTHDVDGEDIERLALGDRANGALCLMSYDIVYGPRGELHADRVTLNGVEYEVFGRIVDRRNFPFGHVTATLVTTHPLEVDA